MASVAQPAPEREPEEDREPAEEDREPAEEDRGAVAAERGGAGAAVLGEAGLALGCCIAAALSWERPLRSLAGFVCANLLFWFLALTSWRVYHLTSLIILGVLVLQIMKDLVFSRIKVHGVSSYVPTIAGAQLWRTITGKNIHRNIRGVGLSDPYSRF